MNRSSPRSSTLALLLTLHGIAILLGPAIHRRERHAGDDRARARTGRVVTALLWPSHADCPICQALDQPQVGVDGMGIDTPKCVARGNPGVAPQEAPIALAREPRPRAPPRS